MKNVMDGTSSKLVERKYDLKGSTHDRRTL